jgi:sporulation integral membrane protein YtvI
LNKESVKFYSNLVICILGGIAVFYLGSKYLLPAVMPFLIAWGIGFFTKLITVRLEKIIRIPRRLLRAALALLLIAATLAVVFFVVFRIATEAWQLLSDLVEDGTLGEILDIIINPFDGKFGSEYGEQISAWLEGALGSLISSVLSGATAALTAFAASVPGIVLFVIVTIISAVYFAVDLEHINAAVTAVLPEKFVKSVREFKENSLRVILKYLRAYLFLMLITFIITLVGFLILRVEYALLIAFAVSILDMLPVIGVGTVLIPWSIFSFVTGNPTLGVGLLVLFLINELVRQFAEPKILGKSLGIHPLITLVMLYAGYSVLGIFGLLLLPLLTIILNTLIVRGSTSEIE